MKNRHAALFLLLVLLAALPQFLPRFYTYIAAIVLLTGLLATSLNLAIGYGGIYQFHHAVFYGIGAYGTALMLTRGTMPAVFGFLAGPLASAALSLVMGLVCIRLSKLYFGMLQISLGSLVWATVYRWYSFTGGDDGIHGVPLPDAIASPQGSYYFTLAVAALSVFALYRIVRSPFGMTLQGIRDNPVRSEAIGVNVRLHQLAALVVAGFFGGVAGMLFVVVDTSVFPDMMFWTFSLEVLVMCLLGGMYTFFGPFAGAAAIVLLRVFASVYTPYWSLLLGVLLTLVIIFLPDGVAGYLVRRLRGREGVRA
ncbi:MAG: branched-chain amino acid ABC transporter permease [Deltaproteobacteria bacterium]|nr:branched-chain amino acid ABC transporter permease [Deltaproteobacteria bacterium]PWB60581.1 MAG: branched-chain amino acid ABC transporter permease [Deltaproteobacteria bacterium]